MAYFRCIGNNGGGGGEYTIEQGDTYSTNTATISVTSGKYYLFTTVYGGNSFTGAKIMVGNTSPIYVTSGIGRTGCIIKATNDTVTYSRTGNVSANEYTELEITNDSGVASEASWRNGTSITSQAGERYFLALADGETGDIVGAETLVEHKLVDTVSNGTRFLIVKATGNTISLNNNNSFNYREIFITV